MGERKAALIVQYAAEIKDKFGETPDMDFLQKVTDGLGPSIYNMDSSKVSGTDEKELQTVKNNFLIKKLGLADGPELMEAIKSVLNTYGSSVRNKHRAVVYYQLAKYFGKESIYN
ncbi:DUF2853 family protein [Eudoraea chungangensis]|uniref:DUF2853 family protein n=1 Tax=Eudoraea chungangensis TaxID=1481905 RepID=UPI0023ED47F3|nr:DUF2853 family protein [Eudoraea chungangensis]